MSPVFIRYAILASSKKNADRSLKKATMFVLVAPHMRDEMLDGVRIRAIPPASNRRLTGHRGLEGARNSAFRGRRSLSPARSRASAAFPVCPCVRQEVRFDMHENLPKAVLAKDGYLLPCVAWLAAVRPLERLMLTGVPIVFAENSYAADYPWGARPTSTILNYPMWMFWTSARSARRPGSVGYIGSSGRSGD